MEIRDDVTAISPIGRYGSRAVVTGNTITLDTVKGYLRDCGYATGLLRNDFHFGRDQVVDLACFAHRPADARSACITVLWNTESNASNKDAVIACREVGAPVVFVHDKQNLEFWQQTLDDAKRIDTVPAAKIRAFFQHRRKELSPDAVYRAKTWGRFDEHSQLKFVDVGLMPVIEREIGDHLSNLVERVVRNLRKTVWTTKREITSSEGHWLVKSAFWLLAAKILQDKGVHGFVTLDWSNVSDVFRRIAKHYDSRTDAQSPITIQGRRQINALENAAETIAQSGHLGHVTTESLAYVYENTLIDKEARVKLGTHSTPPYLVDYLVAKLIPWIEKIPPEQRDVFEPACGHAAFMVSAMRMLKALPTDKQGEQKQFLRKHLHGCEIDSFALEIARLSVTLADIPNPNGWDLHNMDMFASDILTEQASKSTILLTNPPFGNFTPAEKAKYLRKGFPVQYTNKAAEVLGRTLPALRPGAVFGVVVPQGFLHSKNAVDVRKFMVEHFDIAEICLFPDRIFTFSDAESAIILGRRLTHYKGASTVSYRRVREADAKRFKLDYVVTTKRSIPNNRFSPDNDWNMRVPDLDEVWNCLVRFPNLATIADVGKGFEFKGRDLPQNAVTIFPPNEPRLGVAGFHRWRRNLAIHELPVRVRMNLDSAVIRTPGTGTTTGKPQVLLNYAPVGRGPWRLKALIDRTGHAVTSRFTTVRPKSKDVPLEYLWAILNSPIANAYAYDHSLKRDVLVGLMKDMYLPDASPDHMERVATAAREYLRAAKPHPGTLSSSRAKDHARQLLLQVDAEVLRLYALPPILERQILDLFAGQQRVGVSFRFERYFPEDFEPWFSLHEYLSEDYRRSTAGALRAIHEDVTSPKLLEAMRRATEDFKE